MYFIFLIKGNYEARKEVVKRVIVLYNNYIQNKALRIAKSDTNRVGNTTVVIQCGLQKQSKPVLVSTTS